MCTTCSIVNLNDNRSLRMRTKKIMILLILVGMLLGCKDKQLDKLIQKDTVFWKAIKEELVKQEYETAINDISKEELDDLIIHDAKQLYLKRIANHKSNDTLYFLCYKKAPSLFGNIYFEDALKIYEITEDSSSFKMERARIQHGNLSELLRDKNN